MPRGLWLTVSICGGREGPSGKAELEDEGWAGGGGCQQQEQTLGPVSCREAPVWPGRGEETGQGPRKGNSDLGWQAV